MQRPLIGLALSLAAALVLQYRSLSLGWFGDDYLHQHAALEQLQSGEPGHAAWNLFDDRSAGRTTLDAHSSTFGALPWWTSPEFSFALMRPLSAWSHLVDYALWPSAAWAMHLHNVLLFGLLVFCAGALYQRWLGARNAAWIAIALFTIDDAHWVGTAWIANRSVLLGSVLALAALWAHSASSRRVQWLAPLFLLGAHASSEVSIAVWAYLLAFAVYMDARPWRARAISLAPLAAVSCSWFAISAAFGYGVRGSALYVDPRFDPTRFLKMAGQRLPDLVRLQFGIPDSALAELPLDNRSLWAIFSHVFVAAALAVGLRVTWRNPATRMFLLATPLALLPACAVGAFERLLYLSGFGAHALLALALVGCIEQLRARTDWQRAAYAGVALGIVAIHVALALMLPSRAITFVELTHARLAAATRTLPHGKDLTGRAIMVLNAPDYLTSMLIDGYREKFASPGPSAMYTLGASGTPVHMGRTADDVLELEPMGGYLLDPSSWLVRRLGERFRKGEVVKLTEASVQVQKLTPDGRPARIALHADFDDPGLLWMAWDVKHMRFKRIDLPAVGTGAWLPSSISVD